MLNRKTFKHAFSILPHSSLRKLVLLCLFQLGVISLDLMAILLLGLISKFGLEYIQNGNLEFTPPPFHFFNAISTDFEIQFLLLAIIVLILFTARTATSIWGNRRILIFLGNQGAIASNKLLDKILTTDPQYVVKKNSQEFLYSLTSGVNNLILNFLGSLTMLITELFFLSAVFAVILIAEPLTGICALLIFGGTFYLIQKATSGKGKNLSKSLGELTVSYSQELLETLQIYRELVLRGGISDITSALRQKRGTSMFIQSQLFFLPTLSKFLFEFVLVFGSFLVGVVQLLVTDSVGAISALIMFLAAASRILPSIIRAQGALLAVKQSEGASEMAIRQLDEVEEFVKSKVKVAYQDKLAREFIPDIIISNLNFSYDNESRFSLQNISLEIKAGSFVAIVGQSGAGKTTLVDLILGMNTASSGSVSICGLEPLDAARKWPGKIAYVPQNITVIDGDIRKNITLSNDDQANESQVQIALEKSNLLTEIQNMPGKLNEIVGERGMKLSGGQRQRLGIARALFTDPKLIVFDEATSALDSLTEKAVTNAIFNKDERAITLIVIAHRLSTVKNADIVVLLDHGRMIAKGTFEEVRQIAPKFDEQAKLANL